ncbi:MAG: type II and III secretion system protein [Planctomycetes bacterium]|nr:type II and III secretion system protein [Planctomycetota bacterium]
MIKRNLFFVLAGCFLVLGCESILEKKSGSHYEHVEYEIEQLRKEGRATGENIRIVVTMLSTNMVESSALNTLWSYTDKKTTIIKSPSVFSRSGLKVGVATKDFRARLDLMKRHLKSSQEIELFIVIADGTEGYISIGEGIFIPRFYYFGKWYSAVDYEFFHAGRSLKVVGKKVRGGAIELELVPVFSRFLNDGGNLELTELSTKVTVKPGQIMVLGGTDNFSNNVESALLGYSESGEKRKTLIAVTAYLQ